MNFATERTSRKTAVRQLHRDLPGFRESVSADARITAAHRGEPSDPDSRRARFGQIIRLCWESDAFLAHVLYRLRSRMIAAGVPALPAILHRASMMLSQVSIGDPVVMHPGVYIVHGQVVIDGLTEVRSGAVVSPWVTIGLKAGNLNGPVIGDGVMLGTGSKVLGEVTVGEGATVGANAVVVDDVEPGSTVVGAPARPVTGT